jgi:DNA-binding response OmpR family regulator
MTSERRTRILVVEDDEAIIVALEAALALEGYCVDLARDGEAARVAIADQRPELIVLDRRLPRLDGMDVLRWIRRYAPEVPVLVISALGSEDDKVDGLRRGADDYLAKPFGARELIARIEALLRRSRGRDGTEVQRIGDLEIDARAGRVTIGDREIPLSRKEYEVLLALAGRKGEIVSRAVIFDTVWGHFAESGDRQVDWHIASLRRKLELDPRAPTRIVTHHGRGWELR